MRLLGDFDFSSPTIIWDLDQTLIDSSHRNTGDLVHWITHSTAENIMKDSLLPIVTVYRSMVESTLFNHICMTSRELTNADHQFLRTHNLQFHSILHRGIVEYEYSKLPCHLLKDSLCNHINITLSNCVIAIDDNHKNLEMYSNRGYDAIDSTILNDKLRETEMAERYIFVLNDLTGNQMKNPLAVIDTTNMVAVGRDNLNGVFRIVKSTKLMTETSTTENSEYVDYGVSISNGKVSLIGKDEIKAFSQI
jgi:hypothetical protein